MIGRGHIDVVPLHTHTTSSVALRVSNYTLPYTTLYNIMFLTFHCAGATAIF